jgi:hypothetical protein
VRAITFPFRRASASDRVLQVPVDGVGDRDRVGVDAERIDHALRVLE